MDKNKQKMPSAPQNGKPFGRPAFQDPRHFRKTAKRVVGTISVTARGVGYVEVEGAADDAEDLEIPQGMLNCALPDDGVEALLHEKEGELRQSGEITKILHRARTHFVGTFDEDGPKHFFIPDNKKIYKDFLIPKGASDGAKKGDKVQVELVKWDDPKASPEAKVIRVIGKKGDNNAEMHSIVLEKGFEPDYPPEVIREAEKLEKSEKPIKAEEIAKRRDFRDTLTMTIDPADAKDFDDAISFKKLGDGRYEIGVHIADVSHYVRERTALDREARSRGFSVYLVDRTIPMLPEVLSNDICSLNPNEDKLTFSAVFEMNDKAEVLASWFGKTIIRSAKRFTYEGAQEVIEKGAAAKDGGEHAEPLKILNGIAKILQQIKWAKGAIDFEQDEIKFQLDAAGKPIAVMRKVRKDAHKLVEEYMLLANRGVAEFIFKEYKKRKLENAAMLYRIHDTPNPEKIRDLSVFLKALGYHLETHDGQVTSKQIAKVLSEVTGTPEESLIKTAAIRSMAKAVYSTANVGHFGLAYDYYTHFTSPIRRYADLLVHRLLFRLLNGGKVEVGEIAAYQKMALTTTDREIEAAEAERASIKYKQVEFMQNKVGQTFDGTVSGVTEWGIFLEEAETKAEGMVRIRDIGDDFYKLDKKNYQLLGQNTGRKIRLGDKVRFKIMKADMDTKTLDLALV